MSLLHEIHQQPYHFRLALWGLSVFTVMSFVGYFWFTSLQRDIFLALNSDKDQQAAFIADQDARAPHTFAAVGNALGSLTASIGNLLGIDRSEGFDRTTSEDTVHLLPLSK